MNNTEIMLYQLKSMCILSAQINNMHKLAPIIYKFTDLFFTEPILIPIARKLIENRSQFYATQSSLLKKKKRLLKKAIKQAQINNVKFSEAATQAISQVLTNKNPCLIETYLTISKVKEAIHNQKHGRDDESLDVIDLENQNNHVRRMAPTNDWHSLEFLYKFAIIYNQEAFESQMSLTTNYYEKISLSVRHEVLKRAIDPGYNSGLPEEGFDPKDYILHMQMLYDHTNITLLSEINSKTTTPSVTQAQKLTWEYKSDKRTFVTSTGKQIKFRRPKMLEKTTRSSRNYYGYPAAILNVVAQEKNKKRRFSFTYLLEKIIGTNPDVPTSAMSDACKQINQQLLDKCELRDFLIIEDDYFCINTQYLG